MDLRVRFTFIFSTIFVVFLGLFSILVYGQMKTKLYLSAEDVVTQHLLHEFTHLEIPHIEMHSDHGHLEDVYQKIWRDGKLMDDSFPADMQVEPPAGGRRVGQTKITIFLEKEFEGHHYKGLAYYDLGPILHYLSTLRFVLFLAVFLSLILIIPVSFASTKLLLRPFQRLSQTTRSLSAETLSYRLPESPFHDEYGKLVASFNDLLNRLEKSFQQTSRFATNASHELRTPIAVIIGQAERALRKPRENEEYKTSIHKMLAQATALKSITQRLLSLADLERTDTTKTSDIPVKATLEEILKALPYSYETKRKITFAPDRELLYRGNRELFLSIANNLVENSLKYSKEKVEVRFTKHQNALRLEIDDDGPGIPVESREKVFEPFAKQASSKGHGLGLAIVKACLDACQGMIRLGTSKWGGLSVVVEIPEPV